MKDKLTFWIDYQCVCGNSFHRTMRVDPEKVLDLAAECRCGMRSLPREWTEIKSVLSNPRAGQ